MKIWRLLCKFPKKPICGISLDFIFLSPQKKKKQKKAKKKADMNSPVALH
jgi:hypothetical protein